LIIGKSDVGCDLDRLWLRPVLFSNNAFMLISWSL